MSNYSEKHRKPNESPYLKILKSLNEESKDFDQLQKHLKIPAGDLMLFISEMRNNRDIMGEGKGPYLITRKGKQNLKNQESSIGCYKKN